MSESKQGAQSLVSGLLFGALRKLPHQQRPWAPPTALTASPDPTKQAHGSPDDVRRGK